MGWYLGIVMIAQRGAGFQGTFSKFSAVGGVAAIQLLFVVAGCSLAFQLPQDLAGPVVDPGRHTPRLRKSLLCSQLGTLTYGTQICFDPKKEYHFKCFMLKHTTGSKICLPVECSTSPALLQAYAPTRTCFLTVAHHSLSRDVNTGVEPLKKRPRRKSCTLSGCKVAGCTRFLRASSP